MTTTFESAALDRARQGLLAIGYSKDLIRRQYSFADTLTPTQVCTIALAAFAQEPVSYRTASMGVCLADRDVDLSAYQSLGAPQLLEIGRNEVRRWKMPASGAPVLLDRIEPHALFDTIVRHREDWGPGAILRARAIAFDSEPIQLDFFDRGLTGVIESRARQKLDRLLRDALAASKAVYAEHHSGAPDYAELFRLIFRLLAAKLLGDRGYPGNWVADDPLTVLHAIEQHYFGSGIGQNVLKDPLVQRVAWEKIRSSFHLQNISVETLAYVYETTLITPEHRRRLSVHSTHPEVAEYIVRHLPIHHLDASQRHVFEPFAGHGALLIAALGRLRGLLQPDLAPSDQHRYLIEMLSGLEVDAFAVEISRLALMLADYPNPNGWHLEIGDAFRPGGIESRVPQAQIVLCNPPFEDFSPVDRATYPELHSPNKAAEALWRVLRRPPQMLGFVLPESFPDSTRFTEARRVLAQTFDELHLISLPDTAFTHSRVKPALLLAYGREHKPEVQFHMGRVQKPDYQNFSQAGALSREDTESVDRAALHTAASFHLPTLGRVWSYLAELPSLDRVAEIHRGIEYNIPVEGREDDLISIGPRAGFAPGIFNMDDGFEPFVIRRHVYLNLQPELMRRKAHERPWHLPKVLVNAARRSRGPWVITAAPDRTGLVAYQRFVGIWPRSGQPIEVIAALLNGPVANAFVRERQTSRDNRLVTLRAIPVPVFGQGSQETIVALVEDYQRTRAEWLDRPLNDPVYAERCAQLIRQLDAELLTAYDLPPRLERELLKYFDSASRPGVEAFKGYLPADSGPAIPFRLVVAGSLQRAAAEHTLDRLPVIRDPVISGVLADLIDPNE